MIQTKQLDEISQKLDNIQATEGSLVRSASKADKLLKPLLGVGSIIATGLAAVVWFLSLRADIDANRLVLIEHGKNLANIEQRWVARDERARQVQEQATTRHLQIIAALGDMREEIATLKARIK